MIALQIPKYCTAQHSKLLVNYAEGSATRSFWHVMIGRARIPRPVATWDTREDANDVIGGQSKRNATADELAV